MSSRCESFAQVHKIRVTLLDECGRPVAGPTSTIVSSGIITFNAETEKEDGEELLQKNGAGRLCVNKRADDQFKRGMLTVNFCSVDPELFSMVTGQPLEIDYQGNAVGYAWQEDNVASDFAIEAWVGVGDEDCSAGELPYGYFLFPHVTNGYASGFELGDQVITFEITAWTKAGYGWGVGPYDILSDNSGTEEVQTVTITGTPTGGTFTLAFDGQTTSAIAYNAAASAVQTALLALSNLAPGDVVVTGGPGPGTPWVVTFGGAYQDQDVPQMTAVGSFTGGTAPAVAVVTTTPGTEGVPAPLPSATGNKHFRQFVTTVAPPADTCGGIPLVIES